MAVVAISSGAILLWRLLSHKDNDVDQDTGEDDIEPGDISTIEVTEPESKPDAGEQEEVTNIEVNG